MEFGVQGSGRGFSGPFFRSLGLRSTWIWGAGVVKDMVFVDPLHNMA